MKKNLFNIIIPVLIIIGITAAIIIDVAGNNQNTSQEIQVKVLEIHPSQTDISNNKLKVKIISGKHKGELLEIDDFSENVYKNNIREEIQTGVGEKLYLTIEENSDGSIKSAAVFDYVRSNHLFLMIFMFIVLLVLIGGIRGFKSLLTLLLTLFAVIKIIIPCIASGFDPTLTTMIVCIVLLTISLLIVSGFSAKTYAAISGSIFGILCSAAITLLIGNSLKIMGVTNEEAQSLSLLFQGHQLNFKGILYSGILLGSLGALIDLGISIASAMAELKGANSGLSKKDLIKSGMNIGRDIIGAMSNTLILAYAGGSIVLMLVISSYNMSFAEVINQDIIVSEILRALAGSIGLMLSIPFTVFFMAELSSRKN